MIGEEMYKAIAGFVAVVVVALPATAQDEIFSDGFEWGSICAWSNLWFTDEDFDTWGAIGSPGVPVSCPEPLGLATRVGDCDDLDPLVYPTAPEICDFIDNDCDPMTADGTGESWLGDNCDGSDTDLCPEGVLVCDGGAQACTDDTGDLLDTCNELDDDCNPATPDGSDEPWFGDGCDGTDTDLCEEGTLSCQVGVASCSDNTGDLLDVCDGTDNDCDPTSPDGSEDPLTGEICDGSDSDLCEEGVFACEGGAMACSDDSGDLLDVCDGVDNDCDSASPDGSEDPLNGSPCDGSDTDLCEEGTVSCQAGAHACSDNTGSTYDVCDGLDNDCDSTSPDGSEDPLTGVICDGPDSDLCEEGVYGCEAGAITCSDDTGHLLDVCDGSDNDCDPASPDGSEDPLNGATCDGPDTDLCLEGVFSCQSGSLSCSDNTGHQVELCNGLDDDCDTLIDEDFDLDANPECVPTVFHLGEISGDTESEPLTHTGYGEEWIRFQLREEVTGLDIVNLTARIDLFNPPGGDYDLHVYCVECGGLSAGFSGPGGGAGVDDMVTVRRDDILGSDDSFDVIVEIRNFSTDNCGYWQLEISGNVPAVTETCPPPG